MAVYQPAYIYLKDRYRGQVESSHRPSHTLTRGMSGFTGRFIQRQYGVGISDRGCEGIDHPRPQRP
jgi:hypothetical protein